ncbi:MAG: HAD family hydrolase, partial [Pseudomonadota bacterium]
MPQPIAAILFDKDGTLFDFHATWGSVTEQILTELTDDPALQREIAAAGGYDWDQSRFVAGSVYVAGALSEAATLMAQYLPQDEIEIERVANRIALQATQEGALVPAVPDLPGYLAALRSDGFALGVATHDSEESTVAQLSAVGALEAFDFVAGYDSGFGLKPEPGMFDAFAKAVDRAPGEIAMVGDSVGDLAMVPAAGGALAVGVLTGPARAEDLASHADHILASIADLPGLLSRLA